MCPFSTQLLDGHAHEVPISFEVQVHLKEETKMNSFLLHSSLIRVLGAEQSAPKDRRKFPEKRWKYSRPRTFDRARIFWQVVPVQQPVRYGRDAAHISWAVWEQIPLEDCMEERQHHLRESSSAGLRRSQKLEILPSPNSKSLDAYICGRIHLL